MDKIRILHFCDTLSRSSGVMSVIMNYYKNIDVNQVQFDFLYFKDSDNNYIDEIKNLGGNVYKIDKPLPTIKFRKYFRYEFSEIQKNYEYKILHIHSPYLSFIFSKECKKQGVQYFIGHSHATTYSDHFIGKIRNSIIKKLFMKQYFTNYMTCSIAASDFLFGKKAYKQKKVYMLNNAVDTDKFSFNQELRNIHRENNNLNEKIVIGHVGRLEKQKNQLFLLKSFNELNKDFPSKYKLMVIGEGSLEQVLIKYIKENNLENDVLLLGFRNDVDQLFNAMDIFALPSLFEGLPVVAVEAQTNNLPVILSDTITKEVGISNYQFLKIKNPKLWSDAFANQPIKTRMNTNKEIISKGFDIKVESKKLVNYYLDLKAGKLQ